MCVCTYKLSVRGSSWLLEKNKMVGGGGCKEAREGCCKTEAKGWVDWAVL